MRERIIWPLGKRFFAGRTVDDALVVVRNLHANGIGAVINAVGEHLDLSVQDPIAKLEKTKTIYRNLILRIAGEKLGAAVGIKGTQFGLGCREFEAFGRDAIIDLSRLASQARVPVELDAEELQHTEPLVEIFEHISARHQLCRQALQANDIRTPRFIARLNRMKRKVRLTKGAYEAGMALPPEVLALFEEYVNIALLGGGESQYAKALAEEIREHLSFIATPFRQRLLRRPASKEAQEMYPTIKEVRAAYLECAEQLLRDGNDPAFATVRDEYLVEFLMDRAEALKKRLHLQMLYNFRPRWQTRIARLGKERRRAPHPAIVLDVYVPFVPLGERWLPFASRRWKFFRQLFCVNPWKFPSEMWKIYRD